VCPLSGAILQHHLNDQQLLNRYAHTVASNQALLANAVLVFAVSDHKHQLVTHESSSNINMHRQNELLLHFVTEVCC
jgi:hypothetical protein